MRFTRKIVDGLELVVAEGVALADLERAQAMRARRDERYDNIYAERDTDLRWVGDLGEICFAAWLDAERIPYEWLAGNEAAGVHDFLVGDWRMGVKSVKRKVVVRSDFTAQITERHAHEPVDGFFFLTFHKPRNAMYLLGAKGRARFLQEARHYGPGEWVHENYQVPEDHAIYNIEITLLTPPLTWLGMVRERVERAQLPHPDNDGTTKL